MSRDQNRAWWNFVLVVLGKLLPMPALGCESTKRADGPAVVSEDRTGTVEWLLKKPHGFDSNVMTIGVP